MAELAGMFGYPRVDALTFWTSVAADTGRYKKEFADAIEGGSLLDAVSLDEFMGRQQFVETTDIWKLSAQLETINSFEFVFDAKRETIVDDVFLASKKIVIQDAVKWIHEGLQYLQKHNTIHLSDVMYWDRRKMLLIDIDGIRVGDAVMYKWKKHFVAAINSHEKIANAIFSSRWPILIIDIQAKKAHAVWTNVIQRISSS